MRRYFLFASYCFLACGLQTSAQSVAINNDASLPTLGSILDVKSSNKGVLIPRIALSGTTDVSTLPDRIESLLIYNTATTTGVNGVEPGFYFWNGTFWTRLTTNSTSLLSGWLLGGNSGTSTSTHFIGTTDNTGLQFKVNNQNAGYIGTDAKANVSLGYGSDNNNNGFRNVAVGHNALYNNGNSELVAIGESALFSNGTGISNTAVGTRALYANTMGSYNTGIGYEVLQAFNGVLGYNTGIGYRALTATTTGSGNLAIGWSCLLSNIAGSQNAAIGHAALLSNLSGNNNVGVGGFAVYSNTIGNGNIGIGTNSLSTNVSGNDNTALGSYADILENGLSNATAIGAHARVSCSNCMVLGSTVGMNGGISNTNVGIGETNPGFPLNFASAFGDKISFYGNAGAHFGIGIQGGLLQIHSDISTSDVAIGYGSGSSFTQNFKVRGNGDVLLGISNVNATLTFGQSLSKKIIFFHGGTGGDAAMSVFPSELRLQSDFSGAAITFGYDNLGTSFRENMRIEGNGNLQVRGTVTANSAFYTSDLRFKKNISLISHGLASILLLNAYHYNWKDEQQDSAMQTGVIAQEVQKIFPELVHEDNKGYLSVNYVGLIPYLIQSIKEQQDQIVALKKDNEELKTIKAEWEQMKKQLEGLLNNKNK